MDKKKQTYSFDLKKQVVEMYLEGTSVIDLTDKFNLGNRRRVYEWVDKVRTGGYEALKDLRGINSKGKSKKEKESLEEENERLKLENEYLKKLLDLKRG